MKTLYFIFLCFMFLSSNWCYGQYDKKKLAQLKAKYPWGSIYLTYTCVINLDDLLKDTIRLKKSNTPPLIETVSGPIRSLINENKKPIKQAIAFIEIDLNRIEAGYKMADDIRGEIHPIAWDTNQVIDIATFCDNQLNSINMVKSTLLYFQSQSALIDSAYIEFEKIKRDLYVSEEARFLVSMKFSQLISTKDYQLSEIKNNNPILFLDIQRFKSEFDEALLHQELLVPKKLPPIEYKPKLPYYEKNLNKPMDNAVIPIDKEKLPKKKIEFPKYERNYSEILMRNSSYDFSVMAKVESYPNMKAWVGENKTDYIFSKPHHELNFLEKVLALELLLLNIAPSLEY